jgi:organic radical activating enzyme
MKIKGVLEEDFVNYKLPSMFLSTVHCDFKCCNEADISPTICQNNPILTQPTIDVPADEILRRYVSNPITKAIVIGGLEPWLQIDEIIELIDLFRSNGVRDDFVIYTGYYRHEIKADIERLAKYPNIVIKFGRYIPNSPNRYDETLGVTLASDNQHAERIS